MANHAILWNRFQTKNIIKNFKKTSEIKRNIRGTVCGY